MGPDWGQQKILGEPRIVCRRRLLANGPDSGSKERLVGIARGHGLLHGLPPMFEAARPDACFDFHIVFRLFGFVYLFLLERLRCSFPPGLRKGGRGLAELFEIFFGFSFFIEFRHQWSA